MLQRPGFPPHEGLPVRQDGRREASDKRLSLQASPDDLGGCAATRPADGDDSTSALNRTLKHPAEGRFAPGVLRTRRHG
jgi:hypothetical protein